MQVGRSMSLIHVVYRAFYNIWVNDGTVLAAMTLAGLLDNC